MSTTKSFLSEFLPDGLPPRLYKFCTIDDKLMKSLQDHYLWFSSPANFNDPDDCRKDLLVYQPTRKDVMEILSKHKYQGQPAPDTEVDYFLTYTDEFSNAYDSTFESVIHAQGVCCFTTDWQNTLMWSHYANHHKGVVLVFDPRSDLDALLISKVRYVDNFLPYNYFEAPDLSLMRMLTTKNKSWAYEQEYRAVTNKWGPVSFAKDALTEVIFGCRSSEEDKIRVFNQLKTSGYKNVIWSEASRKKNSFSLHFQTFGMLKEIDSELNP